jgi:carbon starvation protein
MILLEGFVITTLDTAVRLNRYLIEEVWQELFGKYDVFADRAAESEVAQVLAAQAGATPTGSGGIPSAVATPAGAAPARPISTEGAFRAFLQVLRYYWVNSGIAVGLMLGFSVSASILQLWKIFGTSNQLLAAFVLGIGTIWLLRSGRKVWYVVVPALLMLVTTFASLVLLAFRFLPREEQGKAMGNAPLFVSDLILIVLTVYLVFCGFREVFALRRQQAAPTAAD